MVTCETTRTLPAPREAVWKALSEVAAWPEWLPTVTALQPLDGAPLALGARYAVRQPRLRPATWVVTELVPARQFTWESRSAGLRMRAEHFILDGEPGTSRVVLRFTFEGLLGVLVGRLYRSTTERYLASEAAALQQRVERIR